MDPTRYNDDQVEFMRRLGVDLDHMVAGSFQPVASGDVMGDVMGDTYSTSWVEVGEWGRIDAERSTVAQTELNGQDARSTVTHHAVLSPHQWSQWADFLPDYERPTADKAYLERVWLNRWVKSGRQADRD